MYAPEGYVSLAEVNDLLAREARAWINKTPYPTRKNETPGASKLSPAEEWNRETAYHVWLMDGFLNAEAGNLYACLPNGRAVKLAGDALLRPVTGEWGFDDSPSGWQDIFELVSDPFTFIEPVHFTIDLSRVEDSEDLEEFTPILRALEVLNGCPVCWRVPAGADESSSTLQALQALKGRPIAPHVPEGGGAIEQDALTTAPVMEGRNVDQKAAPHATPSEGVAGDGETLSTARPPEKPARKAGRPRERDKLKRDYLMRFPEGHEPLNREQVLRELGSKLSVSTLDKVLREIREEGLIPVKEAIGSETDEPIESTLQLSAVPEEGQPF